LTHRALAQKLFGAERAEKLEELVYMQSCVREALQLADTGYVHAMHDATEGGFVSALNELAEASKVGFRVEWEKIAVSKEALILQSSLKLADDQLLAMSSTGTILAAVEAQAQEKVKGILSQIGLSACFLGKFTENNERVLVKKGLELSFPLVANDPYALILSRS